MLTHVNIHQWRAERLHDPDRRAIVGLALVALGVLLFVQQFTQWSLLSLGVLPVLAAIFLALGIINHAPGWIIPGGILGGIGAGTLLLQTGWAQANFSGEAQGGLFLLAFALGWVSIPVLTGLFTDQLHWWPLIPGGVMAFVGGALLLGEAGVQMLTATSMVWPLVLIGIGLYLFVRRGQAVPPSDNVPPGQ